MDTNKNQDATTDKDQNKSQHTSGSSSQQPTSSGNAASKASQHSENRSGNAGSPSRQGGRHAYGEGADAEPNWEAYSRRSNPAGDVYRDRISQPGGNPGWGNAPFGDAADFYQNRASDEPMYGRSERSERQGQDRPAWEDRKQGGQQEQERSRSYSGNSNYGGTGQQQSGDKRQPENQQRGSGRTDQNPQLDRGSEGYHRGSSSGEEGGRQQGQRPSADSNRND
jgi:hypothetical protein